MRKLTAAVIAVMTMGCGGNAAAEHKIWYDRPAMTWTQALPLGNGRLGAMVFGNPGVERIQLNEETIWAGQPNHSLNPEVKRTWLYDLKTVKGGEYTITMK